MCVHINQSYVKLGSLARERFYAMPLQSPPNLAYFQTFDLCGAVVGSSLISIRSREENKFIKNWISKVRADSGAVWTAGFKNSSMY